MYFIIGIIFSLLVVVFVWLSQGKVTKFLYKENIENNIKLFKQVFQAEIRRTTPRVFAEGYYKGRKVECGIDLCLAVDNSSWIYIVPHTKQRFLVMGNRPTTKTFYDGKKIRYVFKTPFLKEDKQSRNAFILKLSEQDIIGFLEELTKAAEIVENK